LNFLAAGEEAGLQWLWVGLQACT